MIIDHDLKQIMVEFKNIKYKVCPHPINLPKDDLKKIVGVAPDFLMNEDPTTLSNYP